MDQLQRVAVELQYFHQRQEPVARLLAFLTEAEQVEFQE
jgi:hypothetical protein